MSKKTTKYVESIRDRHRGHNNEDMVLMSLSDGAKNQDEIRENFFAFARRFGVLAPLYQYKPEQYQDFIRLTQDLEKLTARGLVKRKGDKYALTEAGHQQANEQLLHVRQAADLARNLLQPKTVSKVGVAVHLALAAIKLPAALLSGSIGLFNDSADTLLDGVSSLMVYYGIRFNRERIVNIVLVLMMLLTGSIGMFKAVQRFFIPQEPVTDWFTFFASILSALVCLGLGFYQRYVGLKSGSMALITQSIDSRNHVIVAATVISGLIASALHFTLLDTLVGVFVAGLILKSGIDLAIELIRSRGSNKTDLSRYDMVLAKRYQEFRQTQLRDWMLYLVDAGRVKTRRELLSETSQAFDFEAYPVLKAFGLGGQGRMVELITQSLAELFERNWLSDGEILEVTISGKEHLRQQARGPRRAMRSSFIEEGSHDRWQAFTSRHQDDKRKEQLG
ncbi:MAG: cation transporter [Anaerolineaceae bacterium]|nr:cation transporter [Anaerolineaceae bacterium]MBN2676662.1 cation transporter [Anaerolineaceae bacterium]